MSDPKQTAMPPMTAEQFMDMIRELRKPADPTPKQLAEQENDRVAREGRAQIELNKIANRKAEQSACQHIRPNGTSHCVRVYGTNNLNDYMICQGCRGMIHAGGPPQDAKFAREMLDNGHIFDTGLYNKHFLMTSSTTTF
jgi:hypothetical protein